jgi:subtilisin family serine protease
VAVLAASVACAVLAGLGSGELLLDNVRPARAAAATPDSTQEAPDSQPLEERATLLARLGVDRWHAAGLRGKGIKVAILDSGFRGYKNQLGRALPAHVTVRSFRADGNLEAKDSQHGVLCSEVVHTLAPDAELLLANWDTDSPERFLEAVRWARQQGARIITCSIIMPSWSDGDGGGYVNRSLAKIVGGGDRAGDLLCFASAGNTAQRHWYGRFHDDGAGLHEWKAAKSRNGVYPWGNERVSVELYWKHGEDDYTVQVFDDRGQSAGTTSSHHGGERFCTTVHFMPAEWRHYYVQVRRVRGKGEPFHLVVLGGGLEYADARGSVACPADGPAVLAVGAVHSDGCRACYSSCGPNPRSPKPDFMAQVPFPSMCRGRPFTGTSAAAPQAAALATLCWSRHPDWTAEQIRAALRRSARDLGPPGHDPETGYGLIQMPEDEPTSKREGLMPND